MYPLWFHKCMVRITNNFLHERFFPCTVVIVCVCVCVCVCLKGDQGGGGGFTVYTIIRNAITCHLKWRC